MASIVRKGGIQRHDEGVGVGPAMVAGCARDVFVRTVGDDPVPIKIKRLIERRRAIGRAGLRVEEAVAAREHRRDGRRGELVVDDQRAAGIAGRGDALLLVGGVVEDVEVEDIGLRGVKLRIVEVHHVEIGGQSVRAAEQNVSWSSSEPSMLTTFSATRRLKSIVPWPVVPVPLSP
ncbi:MAG: hypothetical protein WDM81_11870 [Rhizomicrobium sp.]